MLTPIQARCEQAAIKANGVKVFRLKVDNSPVDALKGIQPGRHIAIAYPDLTGKPQQRLYSVIRREGDDTFEIAVKRSGKQGLSDSLHSTLKEGSLIRVEYAAGSITIASIRHCGHVLMAAAGIGITLPVGLLNELELLACSGASVPQVKLVLSVPCVTDIPFLHELIQMSLTRDWFTFQVFITRQTVVRTDTFKPGRPTREDYQMAHTPDAVVICGGHEYANNLRHTLGACYPQAQLFIESFSAPSGTSAPPGTTSASSTIVIAGSNTRLQADPARSILENLEQAGIRIKSQCRSGICGSCRIKVTGDIHREPDFCLDATDKNQGYALACCSLPNRGDIEIDLGITH